MKREKRATNSSQCGESRELEFVEILNSELWLNSPTEGSYRLHFPNDILPNDLKKKSLFLKGQDNIESVLNFYRSNGIDNNSILITIPKIINAKIKFQLIKFQLLQVWYITSFYAEMPPLPYPKKKQSNHYLYWDNQKWWRISQHNQFQDKLDYLMIQRRDFDKFNYSYLYWVPIFNFFDDNFKYISEMSIKLNGFKQNSKFTLIRSFEPENSLYFFDSLEFSSFGNVFRIKISLGMITFYENDKQLIKFIWKNGFTEDFINVLFGQINYYDNTFHFLRYDDKLKIDFKV